MTPQGPSKDSPVAERADGRFVRTRGEHTFVSEIRTKVARMLAQGLTSNEIAHRLDVARSTVGYHLQVLQREGPGVATPPRAARRRHPPVAAPSVTRERVRELLEQGHTRAQVAKQLGLAKSSVSYHAARLGEEIDKRCARRYDWQAIRRASTRPATASASVARASDSTSRAGTPRSCAA